MKKKILMATLIFSIMATGAMGCGKKVAVQPAQTKTEQSAEATDKTDGEEDSQEEDSKKDDSKEKEGAGTKSSEGTKTFDFDNMTFTIDGKIYKLGEATVQDLIDNGVEFEDYGLENLDDVLESDVQSTGFFIPVSKDDYSIMIHATNLTKEDQAARNCQITYISIPAAAKNIVSLSFDYPASADELIKTYGTPSSQSNYKSGDYNNESYEYENDNMSSYEFSFMDGKFDEVNLYYYED